MSDFYDRSPFTFAHEDDLPRRQRAIVWGSVPARLTVKCCGTILLMVGPGEPAPLAGTFKGWGIYLESEKVVFCDGPLGGALSTLDTAEPVELRLHCVKHQAGHTVDGARLRARLTTKEATMRARPTNNKGTNKLHCAVSEIVRLALPTG